MRRYSIAGLLGLFGIFSLLVSCGRGGEIHSMPETQKEIVLIVKSKEGEFWNTVKMGAEAAATEFNVKLIFDGTTDEADVKSQIDLVNKYLAYGTNGLILAANDYTKLAPSVAKADRLGVPVVTIESEVNSPEVRSFIGIDNYEAGRQAALKMKELTDSKGRFIILNFVKGSRNAEQREKGIRDEWAATPGMQVVESAYCNSDSTRCGELTKELLDKHSDIDGILALNAAASIGAAEQLRSMQRDGEIKLVAFDNTPEELEWLQEGIIQATLIQNPFSMGYLGVKTAVEAMNRQSVPKKIDTGTKVIDAENMFWSDNQKMLFPFVQ
ncbi:substrate-binding domain-containing protein [Cohnella silvisoli]|uniref:Substrate-binding domain-containing protein n=1 Tax=Cohnella silvisoli TaxID=2873699 RepID=A0ABV1L2L7_9BACL|nr:substrate-binding domain-containing protein [Cohnella silvisoli]MCD9025874.1 substrate-binding domain-containing protein [Cohnella silvisoli]